MPAPRRNFTTYTPPGCDSPRAKANAVWALLNTPEHKLGTLAPEQLARDFRLRLETAVELLAAERGRRS